MLATMFITLFKVSHSYISFEQLNSFLHSFIQYVFLIEQFNILYNPVINFCTDLSATLHHVAQITRYIPPINFPAIPLAMLHHVLQTYRTVTS